LDARKGSDPRWRPLGGGAAAAACGSGSPVAAAAAVLKMAGLTTPMLIDCSHDNSGKSHFKQPEVLAEVARQIEHVADSPSE
jgi:3-deoxy-7-phosphoheptulonate synthase